MCNLLKGEGDKWNIFTSRWGATAETSFRGGWYLGTRSMSRNWCQVLLNFGEILRVCSTLPIFLQMVWKQKVLPAISAVMWIFLVKMPTLKPQDCALECVYYRGGMTNTDLSSHITCGMDGSHFLLEETTCRLKLLGLQLVRSFTFLHASGF